MPLLAASSRGWAPSSPALRPSPEPPATIVHPDTSSITTAIGRPLQHAWRSTPRFPIHRPLLVNLVSDLLRVLVGFSVCILRAGCSLRNHRGCRGYLSGVLACCVPRLGARAGCGCRLDLSDYCCSLSPSRPWRYTPRCPLSLLTHLGLTPSSPSMLRSPVVGISRPGGPSGRRVSVPRAPAQMGRARGRARRGEARWPETGVREVEIPRPSCSSRA
jgi:hypothetical protein